MADDAGYTANLVRWIAAEMRLLNAMTCAREMFGKSFFALGVGERAVVEQTVQTMVVSNYTVLTADYFAQQASNPVGFHTGHGTETKPPT